MTLSTPNVVDVPHFTVIHRKSQWVVATAAGADDDFADAVFGIDFSVRVLWSEAFVRMFVADEQQISVRGV